MFLTEGEHERKSLPTRKLNPGPGPLCHCATSSKNSRCIKAFNHKFRLWCAFQDLNIWLQLAAKESRCGDSHRVLLSVIIFKSELWVFVGFFYLLLRTTPGPRGWTGLRPCHCRPPPSPQTGTGVRCCRFGKRIWMRRARPESSGSKCCCRVGGRPPRSQSPRRSAVPLKPAERTRKVRAPNLFFFFFCLRAEILQREN